jgi:O-methyltransferase
MQPSEAQRKAFLALLKKTLARFPLQIADNLLLWALWGLDEAACSEIRRWALRSRLGLAKEASFNPVIRAWGLDCPGEAETMVGLMRMHNIEYCVMNILRRNVPGDLAEAGVWRGGACIFMRAILSAYGDTTRKVWVADSFQGWPKPDVQLYPADQGDQFWSFPELAVSLETVKSNFERYGLLDGQVCFLPGWFRDSLPHAPIERLALLRLDAAMYESTMVALRSLYQKVSRGGYVIVDDYGAVPACRQAIDDFRGDCGIREPLWPIDWTGVFWQVGNTGASR